MSSNTGAQSKPLILFSVTNGWGIRNLFYTGLIDSVSAYADIGVVTTPELFPYFRGIQESGGIQYVDRILIKESYLWRVLRLLKKFVLQTSCRIETARIKWSALSVVPVASVLRKCVWDLVGMFSARWQLVLLEKIELCLGRDTAYVLPVNMRAFVNCSPFDFRDNYLLRIAHKSGIPTVQIIPSWDNPSTKGCIHTTSEVVFVWGENQKRELLRYYKNLRPESLCVSGIPQFDIYTREIQNTDSREAFFQKMRIPSGKRVVLYATCSERLFPNEPQVVAHVATALRSGLLGENLHLLIRCHPADRAIRYMKLCADGDVSISPSSMRPGQNLYSWLPAEEELPLLSATLRYCDICVNTASTMTLDAFACGKPVVNVAYDGDVSLPYLKSVRRFYDYSHYAPIAKSGAVILAYTAKELIEGIKQSLEEPQGLKAARDTVVQDYCLAPQVGSARHIAEKLKEVIQWDSC